MKRGFFYPTLEALWNPRHSQGFSKTIIMSTMAKVKGVKGLITDGMVRDIGEIRELEFPIWASGITPIAPSTDIPPGELNLPVSIGEIIEHPGDLVVADDDGVVVVPKDIISEVEKAVKERMKTEDKWVKDIYATEEMILKEQVNKILSDRNVKYLD